MLLFRDIAFFPRASGSLMGRTAFKGAIGLIEAPKRAGPALAVLDYDSTERRIMDAS